MVESLTGKRIKIPLQKGTKRIANLMTFASNITSEHILRARDKYISQDGQIESYTQSVSYDVVIEHIKYPPKAIFGLALSDLLDVEVRSSHFVGSKGSECFKVLSNLGFEIVEKKRSNVLRENEFFDYSKLQLGSQYTKLDAFKTAGVRIPKQARDVTGVSRFQNVVVLFVTMNKEAKNEQHKYQDTFLLDGKLFQWESQNANTLETPHIKKIIDKEDVILFARVEQKINGKTQPFSYLGQISCNSFNNKQKNIPLKFVFDVLNYEKIYKNELVNSIFLWNSNTELESFDCPIAEANLVETPIPNSKKQAKLASKRKQSKVNWEDKEVENRRVGLEGEMLVFNHEVSHLIENGRQDLADKVKLVSLEDDSLGYDIKSFDVKGGDKYIEVKTTKGSKNSDFFISKNEVDVSEKLGSQYWIYRVYALTNSGAKFYCFNGKIDDLFELTPSTFRVRLNQQ